ncbi:unnamed protein product [Hermetia illucens]|uniref:Salivary secreted peptide n=1 Tax=Hermetia illucens TaxID=343691 RepID=A0A7R8YR19_HERIL|nr:probable salivary secreted peptide [Hermetia illucens]CAD7079019.1 unnamed protein product [Hermetia illucens]
MKCSVAFCVVFVAIWAGAVSAQSHNVTWGAVGKHDTLLDREIVVKKSKLLQIVTEDFTYPRKGYNNNYNITAIRCTDQYTNGKGGYAALLNGGPRFKEVTIHLKSQRNHGFNFIIEIYGR